MSRVLAVIACLTWASLIGLGTRTLVRYENTSGGPATPPAEWPVNTQIPRHHNKFTLVMFAHPDCPCTRATLSELEILMTQLQGRLDAVIRFRKPGISLKEAEASDLWKLASAIPGVSVGFDGDGSEVREFGAAVSGQTMLYDAEGKLKFSGGITAARGHVGQNPGVDAVIRRVNGQEAPLQAAVFGCSLRDPDADQLAQGSQWNGSQWKKQ